ncbi:MAG: transcription antitermination factor NusB [Spirochaetota bacterium]|nr:MAG: transcription antitermination factor NusB [Spirochaetota bacterium]
MGSRRSARILALQGLYQIDIGDKSLSEVLLLDWIDKKYKKETIDFARELIEGSTNHIELIDEAIRTQLEHWDLERLSYVDRAILRFSTYSLFFQDDVPDTVIINEAVDLAKMFGTDDSYRFVNGVLDGIRKENSSER